MKNVGRLSSAFSIDNNLFVISIKGRLDNFDGQNYHIGKNPEGGPEGWKGARAHSGCPTVTVKMTDPLKTLIAEARNRRSNNM